VVQSPVPPDQVSRCPWARHLTPAASEIPSMGYHTWHINVTFTFQHKHIQYKTPEIAVHTFFLQYLHFSLNYFIHSLSWIHGDTLANKLIQIGVCTWFPAVHRYFLWMALSLYPSRPLCPPHLNAEQRTWLCLCEGISISAVSLTPLGSTTVIKWLGKEAGKNNQLNQQEECWLV